ncbi:hypothetical protein [Psychroflexus aestuariivivens]|uniref:hypothetical protein n=1 Tax=Psychroflexus aestuariivivens TaxID=1795040 RepID=UPI000FD9FAC7|nr:hypothetical protein [Psychroflexus aestuariivivens]
MKNNREKLSEVLEKRGYKNEDLINEIEQIYNKQQLPIHGVVKSLRDEMAIGFAQTKMQVWDGELTNKHREKVLEDWIRRNGDDLTIAEHIVKDAYFLADEMLRLR